MASNQLLRLATARTEKTLLQVPRALIASCIAAVFDMLIFVFLVEFAGWHPQRAAVVAYLLGGIPQYVLCAVWVFPASPGRISVGFATYTLFSFLGLGITWAVIAILYDGLDSYYILAKCVAMCVAFGWNFAIRKYLIFKRRRTTASARRAEDAVEMLSAAP